MDPSLSKPVLSALALALTLAIYVPYIRSIRDGRTRPHAFSWGIWALGTFTVFFAQRAGDGGVGTWAIALSGLITAYVAALAWRHPQRMPAMRSDWIFLFVALSALPCWWLTADPLWAVIILTGMDIAGFGPTFRAAYHHPHDESLSFYLLGAVRNLLVVLALERYSWTTVLFPAAVGVACVAFVILVALRRAALARTAP